MHLFETFKMYPILVRIILLILFPFSVATAQDAKEMHETAKEFMKQGDYNNAILTLNKAIAINSTDESLTRDLATSYYFKKDYRKALNVIDPLLDTDEPAPEVYLIAGKVYYSLKMMDEAEKVYRTGIRKFSRNGAMYNDFGEFLWNQKNEEAINEWEKGIEKDPAYPNNYYNAARYYSTTSNKIWGLLYGEIFLNMMPFSKKTPEIKELLLEAHKKIFTDASLENNKENNRFETAYRQTMKKQSSLAGGNITPESITMIRTRFILDWFSETKRPSFMLFDFQKQLLQDGLFDAYNQWVFGSAQSLPAFQSWVNAHPDEYAAFISFQKSRIFTVNNSDYQK